MRSGRVSYFHDSCVILFSSREGPTARAGHPLNSVVLMAEIRSKFYIFNMLDGQVESLLSVAI